MSRKRILTDEQRQARRKQDRKRRQAVRRTRWAHETNFGGILVTYVGGVFPDKYGKTAFEAHLRAGAFQNGDRVDIAGNKFIIIGRNLYPAMEATE